MSNGTAEEQAALRVRGTESCLLKRIFTITSEVLFTHILLRGVTTLKMVKLAASGG